MLVFSVHTPDQVKVTDFGLGKLFEDEEEEINTEKVLPFTLSSTVVNDIKQLVVLT